MKCCWVVGIPSAPETQITEAFFTKWSRFFLLFSWCSSIIAISESDLLQSLIIAWTDPIHWSQPLRLCHFDKFFNLPPSISVSFVPSLSLQSPFQTFFRDSGHRFSLKQIFIARNSSEQDWIEEVGLFKCHPILPFFCYIILGQTKLVGSMGGSWINDQKREEDLKDDAKQKNRSLYL